MNAKTVACLLGIAWFGAAVAQAPSGTAAAFVSPEVRALANQLPPPAAPPASLESRIAGLCSKTTDIGDLTEAQLLLGYDVFTVVRDTILACGNAGKAPELAAQVAIRARFLKGPMARPMIDAGVLAAASEMSRRMREGASLASTGGSKPKADSDLERQRLERMMQKGLITDEYLDYIAQKRKEAEAAAPPPSMDPDGYSTWDASVYQYLYTIGLVGGGYLDTVLDIGIDAGGTASSQ